MKRLFQFVKKLPKKFIVLALIVLIILGITAFPRRPQQTLNFYTVKKQDIKSEVSASGTLTGKNNIDLKFKTGGRISSINVKAGDTLSRGQVLASVDNRDQAIALQQAQNTLREKQTAVDKVLDDIHLFQYGNGGFANVGTGSETMAQKQLRTQAEVARDNAFDSLKLAQKNLEDTLIFAPTSGLVTQVNFMVGQTVSASDLIAKMADISDTFFDTEVDEADISKISKDEKAQVTLDAYPQKTFTGKVSEIQLFTKTTSSGTTVVTVRISIDYPEANFINGLTGQASIILSEVKGALTIPLEALRDDNTVVVSTSNGLRSEKVTPGIKSDTDVEIKKGLEEGEKVLLNPPASSNSFNRNRNPLGGILRFLGGGRR